MILQALYEYYQRKAADPGSTIAPHGLECIIRKTKCFDFWERNVLFPKTKRSFFRTPTPPTLPFST